MQKCAQAHIVVLALPAKVCAARAAARVGHEGGVQGPSAFRVTQTVHCAMAKAGPPIAAEGLASIMVGSNCCLHHFASRSPAGS